MRPRSDIGAALEEPAQRVRGEWPGVHPLHEWDPGPGRPHPGIRLPDQPLDDLRDGGWPRLHDRQVKAGDLPHPFPDDPRDVAHHDAPGSHRLASRGSVAAEPESVSYTHLRAHE